MNTNLIFYSTGDIVLDVLVSYTLIELIDIVDPKADILWRIGHSVLLHVKTSQLKDQFTKILANVFKDMCRSFKIGSSGFMFNIGNRELTVDPSCCFYCAGKDRCDKKQFKYKILVIFENKRSYSTKDYLFLPYF